MVYVKRMLNAFVLVVGQVILVQVLLIALKIAQVKLMEIVSWMENANVTKDFWGMIAEIIQN